MNDEKDNLKSKENTGPWWKPAVALFYKVSMWIVVPIVLALIIGKSLDNRFSTNPWMFLGFTGIGFLISSYGIVRNVSTYMKKIEEQNKQNKIE